jgi:hypothetical protein
LNKLEIAIEIGESALEKSIQSAIVKNNECGAKLWIAIKYSQQKSFQSTIKTVVGYC